MNGIELAREYYFEYGKPMIEKEFSDVANRIAVGMVGHGSECFGFDDDISRDHDYEPGFCIWITDEDERKFGFRLFRAYSALPDEYKGIKLQNKSIMGSKFKGVHTISEFYEFYLGKGGLPKTNDEWLSIPSFYLAEATNGEVFSDPLGEFSAYRAELLKGYPRDVLLKKLGSSIFLMAQSGQYNYNRCLSHGEKGAAAVALSEFVKNTLSAVYLLNNTYEPYYKWAFKKAKTLKQLSDIPDKCETLFSYPYDGENNQTVIEEICKEIAVFLKDNGYSEDMGDYLEPYAYKIGENIKDNSLRNSSVIL